MIKKADIGWTQRWSGSYTFISCSYWGPQYFHVLKKILGVNFAHTIFFHRKGTVDFYVAEEELHHLGRTIARKAARDSSLVKKYCRLIKNNTDLLNSAMADLEGRIPTKLEYDKFLKYFARHLAYHGFIKEPVDYLPPKDLERLLPYFQAARLYSESVYSNSEKFFRNLAKTIGRKERVDKELLTCLTQTELEKYFNSRKLPSSAILKHRYNASCLYFKNGKLQLITGPEDVMKFEKSILASKLSTRKVNGVVGYPGIVKARCRVVVNPHGFHKFRAGEVLVTGMTRPEFLPLIQKCSAIVTDSGGILSHAAISARELKKPCVTGTLVATKIFKDGDMLKVDANNGTVRKIS